MKSRVSVNLRFSKNRNPIDVLGLGRQVLLSMSSNPTLFPSPPVPLSELEAAVDALAAAEVGLASRETGKRATRDAALFRVIVVLDYLRAYVQWLADNDDETNAMSIIGKAGMSTATARTALASGLRLKKSKTPHCVDCFFRPVPTRSSHYWLYSIDGGRTWLDGGITAQARTTLGPFTPGMALAVRHRLFSHNVLGDPCDPIVIIVT